MAPKRGSSNDNPSWNNLVDPSGNFVFNSVTSRRDNFSASSPSLTRDIRLAGRRQKMTQRVQNHYQSSATHSESRKAYNAFKAAALDIEKGTYSIDRINGDMYDAYQSDIDESFEVPSGDDAVELSSDQIMLRGNRGVAQSIMHVGNAQLRGMNSLASELIGVQTRNSEAISRAIGASINQGASLIQNSIFVSNGKLDTINNSIQTLINFHNQNTTKYYNQSLTMVNALGKMVDNFQNTLAPAKRSERRFSFSGGVKGFFKGYVDYVTSGIMETMLGSLTGGISNGKPLSTIAGGSPIAGGLLGKGGNLVANLVKSVAKSFLPRSITDRIDTARADFRNITDELLEQISDRLESSKNPLFQSLAGVFGNRRAKLNPINMGAYSKEPIPWNGLAQKALTEVIPELLTAINTSINKGDVEDRYYDYSSGKFMTRSQIQQRYDTEYRDRINASMNPAIQKLTDALEASGKTQSEQNTFFKEVSSLFDDVFAGKDIRTTTKTIRGKLDEFGLEGNVAKAIEREISTGFRNAIRQINDLNNDIQTTQSVYRNLSNQQGRPDLVEAKREQHRDRRGEYNYQSFNRDPRQVIRETQQRLGITDIDVSKDIALQQNVLNVLFTGYDKSAEDSMLEDLVKNAADRALGNTSNFGRFMNGPKIGKIRSGISGGIERIDDGTVSKFLDYVTDRFHDTAFNLADNLTVDAVRQRLSDIRDKIKPGNDESLGNGPGYFDRNRGLGYGPGAASSFMTKKTTTVGGDKSSESAQRVEKIAMTPMDNLSTGDIANNDKIINGAISELQKEGTPGDLRSTIVQSANAVRTSMGAMVSKFIGWGASLFGKEGKLMKLWNSDARKKVTGRLFTDDDAIFGAQYRAVKDWGRGIWSRTKEELAKGYDYVRDSALRSKFGDDYATNENFNDSKFWSQYTDRNYWIQKMQKAKEDAVRRKAEREAAKADDEALGSGIGYFNHSQPLGYGPITTENLDRYLKLNRRAHVRSYLNQHRDAIRQLRDSDLLPDIVAGVRRDRDEYRKAHKPADGEKRGLKVRIKDRIDEVGHTLDLVRDNTIAVTEAAIGKIEENPEEKKQQTTKEFATGIMTKLKSNLPKALAGGIVGAGVGLLNAGNSSILGSLLGPMGPISGAIVGAGVSILSKSEAFQNIMFGKLNEQTGEREGGLLTQKMQDRFKAALPSVVGGAALGALRGVFKSALGFNSGLGVMGMQLLPGGILGGALIGAGVGLIKNSDKFKTFLFGPEDQDGKRSGTFLSNSFNKIKGLFGGDMKQVLFKGLAGAGVGALTGTVLANAGFLPAMLSAGGPIGMGIAGLGLGIASTTKRFNEYIFGSEYVDDEGKTRRRDDGLLSKVRNLININMVEPIGNAFKSKLMDMIDWTKDKITSPFKLAFGPIIDNFKKIGEDIREFAKERMEKFGRTLYNMTFGILKKLFSPFTKLVGYIGKLGVSALAGGAKLLLSPVAALARGASLLTSGARRKQEKTFRGKYRDYLNSDEGQNAVQQYIDILEDDGKGGKNRLNFIQRAMLNHDIRRGRGEFADAFRSGYNEQMTEEDFNALNWRDEVMKKRERRTARRARHKEDRFWNDDIYKIRKDIINRDLRGNSGVTLTDEAVAQYRDRFSKAGIDADWLQSSNDIMQLLYHPDEFRARMNGLSPEKEKGATEADVADAVNEAEVAQRLRDEKRDALLQTIVAELGGSEAAKQAARERLDASIKAHDAHERTKLANRIKGSGIKGIDVNDDRLKAFNLDQIDRATLENFRPTIQTGKRGRYVRATTDDLLKFLQQQHIDPIGGWTNLTGPVPEGLNDIPDVNGSTDETVVAELGGSEAAKQLKYNPDRIKQMAQMYLSGEKVSLTEVGKEFGISGQTVSRYIKKYLPEIDAELYNQFIKKSSRFKKKDITSESTLKDRMKFINRFITRYREKEENRLSERDRFGAFNLHLPWMDKSYWKDLEERNNVHEYLTGIGLHVPGKNENPFNISFPGQELDDTEKNELSLFKDVQNLIRQILNNIEEQKTLTDDQRKIFEEIAQNTSDQAELTVAEAGIEPTAGKKGGRIRQWLGKIFSRKRSDDRAAKEAGEKTGRASGRLERTDKVDENGNPIDSNDKESFWSRLTGGLGGFGSKLGDVGKSLGKKALKFGIFGVLGALGFTVAELIKPGTVSRVSGKITEALDYMNDENGGIGGLVNTARQKFIEFWDKRVLGWWNGDGTDKEGFRVKLKKIWDDGKGGGIWPTLTSWKTKFLEWLPGAAQSFANWFTDNATLITKTVTDVATTIAWPMAQLIWSLVKGLASGIWSGITGKSIGNLSAEDVATLEANGIHVNENVRKTTKTEEDAQSYAERKGLTNAQIVENEDGTYSVIEYSQTGRRVGLDKRGRETHIANGKVIGTAVRQTMMAKIFPKATKSGLTLATAGVSKVAKGATKLIGKIPGIGLVGKAGTVGIKAGETAVKGGSKLLSKLTSVFGKKAASKVTEEAAEAVVEEGVEAVAKGAANTGARLVLSTGETAIQNSSGRWINELTKKFVSSKLIEEATEKEMTEGVEAVAKGAVKLGAKSAAGKAVEEVAETSAKTALNTFSQWIAKIAGSDGLKTAINKLAPGASDGAINAVITKLTQIAIKASETTGSVLKKIGDIVKGGLAKLTADTGAFVFKMLFSMSVGAIFGAIDTATLFGVDKSGVDGTMILVSSILGAFLGFPWIGTILDISMSIATVLGWNIKQDIAIGLYKFFVGNNEEKLKKLELSREQQDLERQIYNALNNTNLDQNAYNDLNNNLVTKGVNWVKGIFGRGAAWTKSSEQALTALRSSGMTDAEIAELTKDQNRLNSTLASLGYGSGVKTTTLGYGRGGEFNNFVNSFWSKNSGTFDRAESYIDAGTRTPRIGSLESIDRTIKGIYSILKAYTRVGVSNMESGKDTNISTDTTSVGYGNGDFNQANGKWANKRIGTFSNGRPATMKDSGCGPTALSMVANELGIGRGPGINPYQVANITRDTLAPDGAATARTLTAGAARLGMSSRPLSDVNGVAASLQHNRPVILSGHGGSGTPYTKAGHIVVADKLLSNGRVRVRNPMGGGSSNYSLNSLKNYTDTAFSMGLGRGPTEDVQEVEGNGTTLINALSKIKSKLGSVFEKLTGFSASLFGFSDDENSEGGVGLVGGETYNDEDPIVGNDVSRFLQVLKTQVGYLEKKTNSSLLNFTANPGSGNFTKYANELSSGNNPSNPWCAYLVSWAAKAADIPVNIIPRVFSCTGLMKVAISNGIMKYRGEYTPVAGDLILFYWNGIANPKAAIECDHVGVVEYVSGNTIHTIEGNTTPTNSTYEGVYRRTRDINSTTIVGYIHPKWRDEVKTVDPSSLLTLSNLVNGARMVEVDNGGSASAAGNETHESSSLTGISLSGLDRKEQVWKFLRTYTGLKPYAAAGVMGNWEAESGIEPRIIEGKGIPGFPGIDNLVTNSQLNNYTTGVLFPHYDKNGLRYSASAYKYDGNYYPGLGLAQWTGERGKKLFDLATKNGTNIWDLKAQLGYFTDELTSGYFRGLVDDLNRQTSPEAAASRFLDKFEMMKEGFAASNPDKFAIPRGNNAQAFYQQFKDTPLGYGTGDDAQTTEESSGGDAELLRALGIRDGMNVNVDSTAILNVLTRIADIMNDVVKNQKDAVAATVNSQNSESKTSNVNITENQVINNVNRRQSSVKTNAYQKAISNQHALLSYRQNVVRPNVG